MKSQKKTQYKLTAEDWIIGCFGLAISAVILGLLIWGLVWLTTTFIPAVVEYSSESSIRSNYKTWHEIRGLSSLNRTEVLDGDQWTARMFFHDEYECEITHPTGKCVKRDGSRVVYFYQIKIHEEIFEEIKTPRTFNQILKGE